MSGAGAIAAAQLLWRRVLAAHLHARGSGITAMIRVRDEAEFLRPAVESIVDLVEEVLIVDNLSRDGSPRIAAELAREHRGKIALDRYPYAVRRVGRETRDLAASAAGRRSPHLSANYYDWCLARCRQPFVLKWDGDMIALPALAAALAAWRESRKPILALHGTNVHPDRRHALAARCRDRAELERRFGVERLPSWSAVLATDASEPRLFPRLLAGHDTSVGFTQRLTSPFVDDRWKRELRHVWVAPAYLHLKFCKRDPFTNYGEDLARAIAANIDVGAPLDAESCELLGRFGVAERAA